MQLILASEQPLFDPLTGDLLPACRDAYVQNQLAPASAQAVEKYLKGSPVQAKLALNRYHALAAEAQAQGRSLVAPRWVQQQLKYQPATSGAGPLRRPLVQVVLGVFLLLVGASVVQWMRNEPLVPAPVAAAVARVAVRATQATEQFVQQLAAPAEPEAPALAPKPAARPLVRPAAASPAARPRPDAEETTVLAARVPAIAPVAADSVAAALPMALPVASSRAPAVVSAAAATPATTTAPVPVLVSAGPVVAVRGRITDDQGRPLAGATVLVQGTSQGTGTDAAGNYSLDVPTGATLLFGYSGYADQKVRNPGSGALNIALRQSRGVSQGGRARR